MDISSIIIISTSFQHCLVYPFPITYPTISSSEPDPNPIPAKLWMVSPTLHAATPVVAVTTFFLQPPVLLACSIVNKT